MKHCMGQCLKEYCGKVSVSFSSHVTSDRTRKNGFRLPRGDPGWMLQNLPKSGQGLEQAAQEGGESPMLVVSKKCLRVVLRNVV